MVVGTPCPECGHLIGLLSSPPMSSGFATASMVLGIVSVPCCVVRGAGLVTAVLAVVFGHIAMHRIKRHSLKGQGMAIAGLVLGYLVLIPAAFLLVAIAVQNFMP